MAIDGGVKQVGTPKEPLAQVRRVPTVCEPRENCASPAGVQSAPPQESAEINHRLDELEERKLSSSTSSSDSSVCSSRGVSSTSLMSLATSSSEACDAEQRAVSPYSLISCTLEEEEEDDDKLDREDESPADCEFSIEKEPRRNSVSEGQTKSPKSRRTSLTRSETIDIGELPQLRRLSKPDDGAAEHEDNDEEDDESFPRVERMSADMLGKKRMLFRPAMRIPEVLLPSTVQVRSRSIQAPEALRLPSPSSPSPDKVTQFLSPTTPVSPLTCSISAESLARGSHYMCSGASSLPNSPSLGRRSTSAGDHVFSNGGEGSDSCDSADGGDPFRVVGSKRASSPFRFPSRITPPTANRQSGVRSGSHGDVEDSVTAKSPGGRRTASLDLSLTYAAKSATSPTHRSRSVAKSPHRPLSAEWSPVAREMEAKPKKSKMKRLFRRE